jgi:hypothetical protein
MYGNGTNGKWKFVFLGWQTINCNRWLLCQQMFPSIVINIIYKVYSYDSVHNIEFNIFWHWPIQVCIQHSVCQHSMFGIFDVQFINAQSYLLMGRTQWWVTVYKTFSLSTFGHWRSLSQHSVRYSIFKGKIQTAYLLAYIFK